jgi:hypothetical protein
MEHRHGFRHAFVRGVTTGFLLVGLGVEHQTYGLREVTILLKVHIIMGWDREKLHGTKSRAWKKN